MNELRKDYLLNRYVIISPRRGNRPDLSRASETKTEANTSCPFCPAQWSPADSVSYEGQLQGRTVVRVVKNKFSAVSLEGNPELTTHNTFYTFASAYGIAEVVIDTPDHGIEFEDLPVEHIVEVLTAYKNRILALSSMPNIKYVSVFKNRGKEAGASIPHAHSQVIAHNMLPPWIDEELLAHYKFVIENGTCPYCEIIKREKDSYRRICEDEHVVAFTPYASRFPYEAWIFPKAHLTSMADLNEYGMRSLATTIKTILMRLNKLGRPAYNLKFHNAELVGENFHFHVEIIPRTAIWAGFELETGTIINTVSPENAAKFYRGEDPNI